MMALESVFSTPPPVVGARYKDETMKHGEKESNDEGARKNNGDVQHLEEGELEEGEIIEEERDDGLRGYGTDNGPDDQGFVRKKKKKRKKRKRDYDPANAEGSAEALPGKKKRARYIDHDSVANTEEDWVVQGPRAMPNMRRNYPFEARDSPPMFPRGRSPQDLYDSPYNSNVEEQQDDGPVPGEVERLVQDAREIIHEKGRRDGNRRGGKEMRRLKNMKKKEMRRRPICKFFLDGKCAKGAECTFLHEGAPPKKTDLCKFYLNGFCAKGEGCLYMHEDFPCKFFHTGAKCYAGDNCKFSHSPLNEDTRRILDSCLDSPIRDEEFPMHGGGGGTGGGPPPGKVHRPSLLGSPPAHIKEMVVQEARKKNIPSLFDIQVKPPTIPAGHQQQMRPNFYRDQGPGAGGSPARPPLLPMPQAFQGQRFGGFERMPPPVHTGNPDNDSGPGNARHHVQSTTQNAPVDQDERCSTPINNRNVSDDDGWESDRCDRGGFVRVETTDGSPMWVQKDDDDDVEEDDNDDEQNHIYDDEPVRSDEEDNSLTIDERCHQEPPKDVKEVQQEKDAVAADKWDSSSNSGSDEECQRPQPEIAIPTHLPKKQRELFLRIQQQQREANSIQIEENKKKEEEEKEESKKEEEGDEEEKEEEPKKACDTWYSSDEEDDDNDVPLAAVLKKLQQEPVDKPSHQTQNVPKVNLGGNSGTFDIAKMLQAIRNKGQPETVPTPAVPAKDPRAVKPERQDPRTMRGSRDPRLGRAPPAPVPVVPVQPVTHVVTQPEINKSSEPKKNITAFHPMAYKLQAIAATHANYSTLQGLCKDPKFQNDPRLRVRSRPAVVSNGNSAAKGIRQTSTVKMPASRTSSRSSSATKDSGESDCEMTKRPSEPISSPPLHGSFGNSSDTAPTSLITLVPLPVVPIPPPLPPLLVSLGPPVTVPEPVKKVAEKTTQKHRLVAKKALRIGKIVPGTKKNLSRGVGELPRSVLELRKGLNYESPLAFSDRTETPTLSYNRKPLPDLTIAASQVEVQEPKLVAGMEVSGCSDEQKDMETGLVVAEEDIDDAERNKSLKDMFQTKDPTASPFC